ncbi:unannotated protein [freshwater metagenome]|uniref:Unannotated protein n=1 Tax=freshwater metagenome TaxID=449393 RepID=A0A6J7F1M9_9ZZZZ|nr:methyltransferase domain-containing protein [Actinomycetota bacterium]
MSDGVPPDLANAAVVSPRWVTWRERTDINDYDQRFERMAAAGQHVHGEADFIAGYAASSILDAGCGTGRIAIELDRRGCDVVGVDLDADMIAAAQRKAPHMSWAVQDLARMQLSRRFGLVAMPGNVMLFCQPDDRRLIVHNLAQHLEPGGMLLAGFTLEPNGYTLAQWDQHCAASGLTLLERFSTWERQPFAESSGYHVSVHRRVDRFTVHDLLAEARSGLSRLSPAQLSEALRRDDVVVLDTRQGSDRETDGCIEHSLHCPRTVVEWRADPASGYSSPAISGFGQRIVVVCNDGYSSSLAAATLQRLGFTHATDLIGGFQAWSSGGFPVVRPPVA